MKVSFTTSESPFTILLLLRINRTVDLIGEDTVNCNLIFERLPALYQPCIMAFSEFRQK